MVVVRRMNGRGTGFESASVGGVGVWDVEMGRHWTRRVLLVSVAEFDDIRGTDSDFSVHDRTVRTRHADTFGSFEGKDEEIQESRCATDKEVRRDVVETRTPEIGVSGWFWNRRTGFVHGRSPEPIIIEKFVEMKLAELVEPPSCPSSQSRQFVSALAKYCK